MKHLLLAGVIVVAALIWTCVQWNECKDAGFSNLYCLQHID